MYTPQQIIEKRREQWNQHHNIELDRQYIESVAQHIVEHPEIVPELQEHPEYLVEMVFVVVDKDRNTVPFFLNELQHEFVDTLNQAKVDYMLGVRLHLKFMLLKGRQGGFTTIITALQLASSILNKNYAGFTLADEANNTESIFNSKAKFMFDKLPSILKPSTKYNSKRELYFDKLNSSWEVATAGNKDVGRSKTLNFFHGSESAFWDNLQHVMTGLGEALTKDSIQILETTANGYNQYKDMWDEDNNYEDLFFEWWKTAEYRLSFESPEKEAAFKEKVQKSPDDLKADPKEEKWIYWKCKKILEIYGLDWNQVYWYYNKWKDKKEKILQEYPCNPDEAFLASGRCVFNKEKLISRKEYLKKIYEKCPPKRGRFAFEWNSPDAQDYIVQSSIRWVDDPNGFITIYEDVKPGYPYVLAGDTKGEGKDFYAGTAINNNTGNRCAVLHVQLRNSKPFTHQMYCLGLYFNTALIGIEMNWNTAPIEELERLHYPRQYVRQAYDDLEHKYIKAHGWRTDGNTRPLIIDKEIAVVEEHIELLNDITMINEALTFVEDKNNRPDAESSKHDDVLMSDMIANEIRKQQSYTVSIQASDIDDDEDENDHKGKNLNSWFD